ncbi:MAG: hypothetical protein LBH20_08620 [Treponema sp.]|jgi:hypothetical protein|nr:hypothetical protein [Treponema sp.]
MAIQPIDLQVLFTQLDTVGKAQSAQREGLALQQAIQGAQIQRKTEEHIQAVNETQNTGDDGVEKVKDQVSRRQGSSEGKKKETGKKESEREKTSIPVFCDPSLGRNIDISL